MYKRNAKGRRRNYAKKASTRSSKAKVSKPLKRAIKAIAKSQIETKTINVADAASASTNTVNRSYLSLGGLQILAADIFSVPKGVNDDTSIGALNRIGDKIQGVGFLMDYYFHTRTIYAVGNTYFIPFIKLRIVVWRQQQSTPTLNQSLLCDTAFLAANTSTLQPINWDVGYVKEILYDKVHVIHNSQFTSFTQSGCIPSGQLQLGNVFHFKKYIKWDTPIKFLDNQSTPNATNKPIYMGILAELDDSYTGIIPSSTPILMTTGYTRAWFKDG